MIQIHEYSNGESPDYSRFWGSAPTIEDAEVAIYEYWSERNDDGDGEDTDNKRYAYSLELPDGSEFIYKIDYKGKVVLPTIDELKQFIDDFNDYDLVETAGLEGSVENVVNFCNNFHDRYGVMIPSEWWWNSDNPEYLHTLISGACSNLQATVM